MYLTEADGVALLRRIVAHFPSGGELQFDAFSRFGIRTQWSNAVVRRSGATLYWGINRPDEIVAAVPGVRLLAWQSPVRNGQLRPGVVGVPGAGPGDVGGVRATKYMAQYHRYAF